MLPCLAAVAWLLGSGGCEPPGGGCLLGTVDCPCTSAGACDPGLTCQGSPGICLGEGGSGFAGAQSGIAIGAACEAGSQCGEGLCLSSATIPGGYCSKSCGGSLETENPDCPGGSSCFQINEATSVCLDLCGGGSGDCRSGYRCQPVGGSRICLPSCKSDADCEVDAACNVSTGECRSGAPRAPGRMGSGCTTDAECASGICIVDEPAARPRFPGGYCAQRCDASQENKTCGDGGICVGARRDDGSLIGYLCLGACRTGVDCRPEYMCSADVDVQLAAGVGMCLPRCEYYDCDPGQACDRSVGVCVEGGMTAGEAAVTYQDLGTVPLGPTRDQARTFDFQVAPGSVSFAVIAEAESLNTLALLKMVAPNGQAVFDRSNPADTAFQWFSYGRSAGTALLFPNAPRVTLIPGNYQMTWAVKQPSQVRFSVLQKRQAGVVQSASLPVRFVFTRNQYLDARTAQSDPGFQEAVTSFKQIYAAAGINVGPVSYVDMTGPQAVSLAVIDDDAELSQLFGVGASSPEPALHFLIVEQIIGQGGFITLGTSDGIPGAPAYPGVYHSGVAVSLFLLKMPGGVARLGSTISHEAGHYLGLFHVTERDGKSHDPLIDTPECGAEQDTNRDASLSFAECVGRGSDNLMFWTSAQDPVQMPRIKLTSDQRFVLLRNPTIR